MTVISLHEMEIILEIIKKHVPKCKVLAFGSRFKRTHKDSSDLDLAIVGDSKINSSVISNMKTDFMESDLLYKVDIVDYSILSPEFKKIVDDGCEVIYEGFKK